MVFFGAENETVSHVVVLNPCRLVEATISRFR